VDLLPNIEFPQLSIEVVYPGASPQDVNEEVTAKLEEKLKSLDGLKQMQSSSYEGMAVMNLEFPFRTDMEKMERQVESLIDQ
ncbi:efflux RND transporter permease subunit, partial [Acinetobacter baumannii]